jgi:hypothetical protein
MPFVSGLLLCAALLLVSPGSAKSQQLYACVAARTGAIRMVVPPDGCNAKETAVAWNVVGPPGPPGTPGEPGTDGEPGPPGSALQVFDGHGNKLGLFGGGDVSVFQVFDEANGVMLTIGSDGNPQMRLVTLSFATTDCTGTPYFFAASSYPGSAGVLYSNGQHYFAIETPATEEIVSISSHRRDDGVCFARPAEDERVWLGREVVLGLTFPVARPLYVGLPPR